MSLSRSIVYEVLYKFLFEFYDLWNRTRNINDLGIDVGHKTLLPWIYPITKNKQQRSESGKTSWLTYAILAQIIDDTCKWHVASLCHGEIV